MKPLLGIELVSVTQEEKLALSCPLGDGIKLLDLQTFPKSEAFVGYRTGSSNTCPGGNGQIYLQVDGNTIVQLNAVNSTFQGPLEGTLHTDMYCKVMYYISSPNDIIVLIDEYSSRMVAMSFVKDEIVWEFQELNQRGDNYMYRKSKDRTGLLFYEKYNVLLVADGINERVLIVDPQNGRLIQDLHRPNLSNIAAVGLYEDPNVMVHSKSGYTISYFKLLPKGFLSSYRQLHKFLK